MGETQYEEDQPRGTGSIVQQALQSLSVTSEDIDAVIGGSDGDNLDALSDGDENVNEPELSGDDEEQKELFMGPECEILE